MIPQQLIKRLSKTNKDRFFERHGHKRVRIVSRQYEAYWKPNGAGYCQSVEMAGIFTLADAYLRSGHVGPEKGIFYEFVRVEPKSFFQELMDLINRRSMEKPSNTPDYILAGYLVDCLKAYENAIRLREVFGKPPF